MPALELIPAALAWRFNASSRCGYSLPCAPPSHPWRQTLDGRSTYPRASPRQVLSLCYSLCCRHHCLHSVLLAKIAPTIR
ncbi:hypothetical protein IF1G_04364 [Cordyceps javanica]|uniref:Uncharacterized protein n=1 Tax=Cordyceps javanica TaxID=43265 RepID=A0A545V5Z0_9HYPO|nr:hypothetical protein IF1G_04364 [Cordyceps javanica]